MELCKGLNYLRSLFSGKGTFYYLDETNQHQPIVIDQSRLRTSRCSYSEMYSDNNFTKNATDVHSLATSNIHYIEECYVPFGVNTVFCHFSLRIQANSLTPNICINESTKETLKTLAQHYNALNGYQVIAEKIAKNILMGNWLWRNRSCRNIEMDIQLANGEKLNLDQANNLSWHETWKDEAADSLEKLTNYISSALTNPNEFHQMEVTAKMSMSWGDELFPSQEFIDKDENKRRKQENKPIKQLARARIGNKKSTAAFHAQKIGAALQLIDDWYEENAPYPLRVNEYGADRQSSIARRHPLNNNDFYQLISRAEHWNDEMKNNKKIPLEVHYIISVLIKGGMFTNGKE